MLDLLREYWWVVCGAIGALICIAAGLRDYLLDRANPTSTPKPSSFLIVCALTGAIFVLGPIGLGMLVVGIVADWVEKRIVRE